MNSSVVEPNFAQNAQQIARIVDFLDQINHDDSVQIASVSFCGTTSPEGSYQLNRPLGQKRLAALEQIVRSRIDIPDSLIVRDDHYLPWADLAEWVRTSNVEPKAEILAIINEAPSQVPYIGSTTIDGRIQKLRNLDGGRVWSQMNSQYFTNMRSASAVIITFRKEAFQRPAEEPELPTLADAAQEEEEFVATPPEPQPEPEPEPVEEYLHHVHLKTNLVGWGLSMANLAVEVDLCDHLSFALPIYYSGMDYFTNNLKFRVFAFQPEFRYWTRPDNDGFFLGAHFGMGWYNFAFKGDYRYQDHARHTPALGGGLSIGYRLPISKNRRWRMEFAVGGGAYDLHYDRFYNEPNGKLVEKQGKKKTYIGLDQASIAFAYSFDMKKKGGKK